VGIPFPTPSLTAGSRSGRLRAGGCPQARAGWRRKLMAWISGKVARTHVLCVEDGLARPSDPFVSSLDGWRFFCQESVHRVCRTAY